MRHRVIAVALLATLAGGMDAVRSAFTTRTHTNASYLEAERVFAPRNVAPPEIYGTPRVGAGLGGTTGEWRRRIEQDWRLEWVRCDAAGACQVVGEGHGYYVTAADVGSTIHVEVTGTNSSGSTTARSAPVGPVAG